MDFPMEKTPVRSSTDLPYSAWQPLSWLSTLGSLEIHSIMGDADDIAQWMKSVEHWQRFQKKEVFAVLLDHLVYGRRTD